MKQGYVVKSWKNRLFVLYSDRLEYYEPLIDDRAPDSAVSLDIPTYPPRGIIRLAMVTNITSLRPSGLFRITTEDKSRNISRDYLLNAPSDNTKIAWIEALQRTMYKPTSAAEILDSGTKLLNEGKLCSAELDLLRQWLGTGFDEDLKKSEDLIMEASIRCLESRGTDRIENLLVHLRYSPTESQLLAVINEIQSVMLEGYILPQDLRERLICVALERAAAASGECPDIIHNRENAPHVDKSSTVGDTRHKRGNGHLPSKNAWSNRVREAFGMVMHTMAVVEAAVISQESSGLQQLSADDVMGSALDKVQALSASENDTVQNTVSFVMGVPSYVGLNQPLSTLIEQSDSQNTLDISSNSISQIIDCRANSDSPTPQSLPTLSSKSPMSPKSPFSNALPSPTLSSKSSSAKELGASSPQLNSISTQSSTSSLLQPLDDVTTSSGLSSESTATHDSQPARRTNMTALQLAEYLKEDHLFFQSYRLGEKLGEGAYSTVYTGVHMASGMLVAVKIAEKKRMNSAECKRLEEEVGILARLDHPHIIRLHAFYDEKEAYYIVQERCTGGELFDRIVSRSVYSENEARDIVRTLAEAVKYMHDKGIVHRDLKPENILLLRAEGTSITDIERENKKESEVDPDQPRPLDSSSLHPAASRLQPQASSTDLDLKAPIVIKIADLGFAKAVPSGGLETSCGTPSYVAPEILKGEKYGFAADCWSLGVITYILLCGYAPFSGSSQPQLFRNIVSGKYYFDRPYWDGVSTSAKSLIRSLLVTNPEKRATAAQILEHPWFQGCVSTTDLTSALKMLRSFNKSRKVIIKKGELVKQGYYMKNWKSRMCVLTADAISYYDAAEYERYDRQQALLDGNKQPAVKQQSSQQESVRDRPTQTVSNRLSTPTDTSSFSVSHAYGLRMSDKDIEEARKQEQANDRSSDGKSDHVVDIGGSGSTDTQEVSSISGGFKESDSAVPAATNRGLSLFGWTRWGTSNVPRPRGTFYLKDILKVTVIESPMALPKSSFVLSSSSMTVSSQTHSNEDQIFLMKRSNSSKDSVGAKGSLKARSSQAMNSNTHHHNGKSYLFKISTVRGRVYVFACASAQERAEWISIIARTKERTNLVNKAIAAMRGNAREDLVRLTNMAENWQAAMALDIAKDRDRGRSVVNILDFGADGDLPPYMYTQTTLAPLVEESVQPFPSERLSNNESIDQGECLSSNSADSSAINAGASTQLSSTAPNNSIIPEEGRNSLLSAYVQSGVIPNDVKQRKGSSQTFIPSNRFVCTNCNNGGTLPTVDSAKSTNTAGVNPNVSVSYCVECMNRVQSASMTSDTKKESVTYNRVRRTSTTISTAAQHIYRTIVQPHGQGSGGINVIQSKNLQSEIQISSEESKGSIREQGVTSTTSKDPSPSPTLRAGARDMAKFKDLKLDVGPEFHIVSASTLTPSSPFVHTVSNTDASSMAFFSLQDQLQGSSNYPKNDSLIMQSPTEGVHSSFASFSSTSMDGSNIGDSHQRALQRSGVKSTLSGLSSTLHSQSFSNPPARGHSLARSASSLFRLSGKVRNVLAEEIEIEIGKEREKERGKEERMRRLDSELIKELLMRTIPLGYSNMYEECLPATSQQMESQGGDLYIDDQVDIEENCQSDDRAASSDKNNDSKAGTNSSDAKPPLRTSRRKSILSQWGILSRGSSVPSSDELSPSEQDGKVTTAVVETASGTERQRRRSSVFANLIPGLGGSRRNSAVLRGTEMPDKETNPTVSIYTNPIVTARAAANSLEVLESSKRQIEPAEQL